MSFKSCKIKGLAGLQVSSPSPKPVGKENKIHTFFFGAAVSPASLSHRGSPVKEVFVPGGGQKKKVLVCSHFFDQPGLLRLLVGGFHTTTSLFDVYSTLEKKKT